MRFSKFIEMTQQYPDIRWIVGQLRNNLVARCKYKVLGAFIVGSEAKMRVCSWCKTMKQNPYGLCMNCHRFPNHKDVNPNSDLDIAVVIPEVRGKTALQVSEYYHSKFSDEKWKPNWNGRIVDFQFFYPNDSQLESYDKIQLS